MERHDEEKPDFLFLQPVFDLADQSPSDSLPVMVRVDAQPVNFRADGAVPFEQQQTARPAANPRNPNHPPARVKWGPASTDEMAGLHIEIAPVRESDAQELSDALWGIAKC